MSQESSKQDQPRESLTSHLALYAKGVAMGMGDSVPGISGGTIAVITHIYDKLIFSIRAVDLQALSLLFHGNVSQLWRHINGTFLGVLALGILSGLLLSANTVLYLLDNHFEALMAFFIGLVLASSWLLKNECNLRASTSLTALIVGAVFTVTIGMLPPVNANFSLIAIFLSGAIAICAMILPGLSGAFILLILGVYEYVLRALLDFNLPVILVFMLGCIIGLLVFSRFLAWMLRHYHDLSYGFIIGMLLGSLSVLWPWQHTQSYYTSSSGELHPLQAVNLLPPSYTEITGQDPHVLLVIVSLFAGAAMVLGLQWLFTHFTAGPEVASAGSDSSAESGL